MSAAVNAIAALLILVLCSVLPSTGCRAEHYVFDAKNTEVRFAYTFGFAVQYGRFTSVEGTMEFDEKMPERSHAEARIKTASLTTGEPFIEDELKSRDFFNAVGHPEIRFESRAVRPTGINIAQMTGEITVNGVTKPVTLEVTIQSRSDPALRYEQGSRHFVATARLQRSAFNMTAYTGMVADEVDIVIDAVLRRASSR